MVWEVRVTRRGRIIYRSFFDNAFGGRDESLNEAKAYRDAVMNLFPPLTNREIAETKTDRNNSGMPGILRTMFGKQPVWKAYLRGPEEYKQAYFHVHKYGEKRAKALAIKQRQDWLDETDMGFRVIHERGNAEAQRVYFDILEDPELTTDANLAKMMAEGEARLAEIDAEFDARRPVWLHVRLHARFAKYSQLFLRIGDGGNNAATEQQRRASTSFHPVRRPLEKALRLMRKKAGEMLEQLFDRKTRDTFLRRHGRAFRLENFDCRKGLTVREIIQTKRGRRSGGEAAACCAARGVGGTSRAGRNVAGDSIPAREAILDN